MPLKLKNMAMIMLGAAIYAFGLNYFNIANQLVEGGFTGLTLLLNYLFGFSPAVMNLLLNIPLFLIGWKVLGSTAFIYTILGTVSLSLFLWLFKGFHLYLGEDLLLAALYAGVTAGVGLGIVFRYGGTTGGVDIIARLAKKYLGWSMGKTMFAFDVGVLTLSMIYLDHKLAMYTVIAVYIGARVIDFVQEVAYAGKAVMIISDSAPEIAQMIIQKLDRGATLLKGKGGYTGSQKEVLYCVISRNELFRLKNLIREIDPYAFVVVHDVRDVLGEGFTLDEQKKPLRDDV
ncbi:membrane protein [Caldalkalibacillus thermarum]|uniref:YitT family protein n=1 Tax=Caldalkalibacillus thermarum TaxID=296745 RepID=UPI00166DD48F|nr:YitT family protein [Caldalkalibacillus thermarum]GGK24672.1 membrane protein [Caldalkalibacillus thermarum]